MTLARSTPSRLPPGATEEQLLGEIAYYKARLADIRKAPTSSRHREALEHVETNLQTRETLLVHLRDCRRVKHR